VQSLARRGPPDKSSATFRMPTLAKAQTLGWFDVISAPFACIDRALAGDELRFDESLLSACEDWDLWLRLVQQAPVPCFRSSYTTTTSTGRPGSPVRAPAPTLGAPPRFPRQPP